MFVAFEHLGALGSLHRIYQPGLRSLIVAQASASGVSVVLAVGQMLLSLGEQGRPGLGITVDRSQQFRACPQFHALPARPGGAFHDHRPLPLPGLDGIKVGGKSHVPDYSALFSVLFTLAFACSPASVTKEGRSEAQTIGTAAIDFA